MENKGAKREERCSRNSTLWGSTAGRTVGDPLLWERIPLADNRGTGDSQAHPQSLRLSTRRGPCLWGRGGKQLTLSTLYSHPSDECQRDPRSAGTRTVEDSHPMPAFTRFFDEPLTYVRVAMNTRGEKGAEKRAKHIAPSYPPGGQRPAGRCDPPLGSGSPWSITEGLGLASLTQVPTRLEFGLFKERPKYEKSHC